MYKQFLASIQCMLQCDETRAHHVHSGRTSQYLQHPLTLKAVIWYVPPDAKICSYKKFQSSWTSSSRDMAKYVGKITKKREKEILKVLDFKVYVIQLQLRGTYKECKEYR